MSELEATIPPGAPDSFHLGCEFVCIEMSNFHMGQLAKLSEVDGLGSCY